MDCRVCRGTGESWPRMGGGTQYVGGGFSHESEHDLGAMVSDFLENGSGGPDSRYSSDSDSGLCDLVHLADTISVSPPLRIYTNCFLAFMGAFKFVRLIVVIFFW